ncbi:SulP family inorganic anion transporter [Kineosporia sp. A_224]|uniref:SulP family inorganic anion transporter n=1 Tax=Kineosporia sp. A_224 TaxID=1962180 RepID=UPI000B4B97F2|nr:SulP family inorganic anion transporter [Kineosporia sp. A_224]
MARLSRRPAIDHELDEDPPLSTEQRLAALAPGVAVLRGYQRRWLRADVFAGLAVAAYLVPQVMAYAAIVGVQPVAGLWTALAAAVVYALLGSSRVLSAGPESTVALMAAATVAPLAHGDAARAAALTSGLCLVVAAWCLVARVARLGVVADLLSQPLLVGYLAGGAVLMVVGQLGRITRTEVDGESIVAQVGSFAHVVGDTHWPTVLVCAGTLALLLGVQWLRPSWPGPLVAVAVATLVSVVAHLSDAGVRVVGSVPSGLPRPQLPAIGTADLQTLAIAGLAVAVVAYGDNTLIARGFPAPADDDGAPRPETDPQQELLALAGVHAAAGLVGGFPVSSSGSRTALAIAAGARTQAYSLVGALVVVVVLFAAGPLLSGLPAAALGAVVLYAASRLVSWREFVRLARFRSTELALALASLVGTVVFGILTGVAVAIALSLLEMASRLARPHEGVLGRVPGLAGMHDVDDYPDAQTLPGLVVYRYDAPLFFANVADLRRRALRVVEQEDAADPEHRVRWFVLNVEANVEIDITAADGLRDLHADLAARGVRLGLARVKNDLLIPLGRAGLDELIGADMLFATLPVAEEAYLAWAQAEDDVGAGPTGPDDDAQ